MPHVSIILPTYNRAHTLDQAIDSVLRQSYEDWELIIVDDGSEDITKKLVLPYLEDRRIRYVYEENSGPAIARNRGVSESQGDIIMYLDSDDVYFPEAVSFVVSAFTKNKSIVFGTGNQLRRIMLVDTDRRLLCEKNPTVASFKDVSLQDIYHWNVKFCGSALFHKRSIWENGIQWDSSFHYFEDWHFLLTIGREFPHGFVFIPELMCEYRLSFGTDGINATSNYEDLAQGFAQVYQAHRDDPLMADQQWYPERVEKYTTWQKEVDAGVRPPSTYKYFEEYFKKQQSLAI